MLQVMLFLIDLLLFPIYLLLFLLIGGRYGRFNANNIKVKYYFKCSSPLRKLRIKAIKKCIDINLKEKLNKITPCMSFNSCRFYYTFGAKNSIVIMVILVGNFSNENKEKIKKELVTDLIKEFNLQTLSFLYKYENKSN